MPCSSATAVERVTKLSFIHYPSDELGWSERIAQSGVLAIAVSSTHASPLEANFLDLLIGGPEVFLSNIIPTVLSTLTNVKRIGSIAARHIA